ncbi:MAG TPA: winged helix-turn-helix transcriptional regulator [Propionibacterium sp.]|nr:winged helix-turn-helix transcriptional regulator [Propionibacterium sp.]
MAETTVWPLVSLIARVKDEFEASFARRLKDSEFGTLSLAHASNVLRHLDEGPHQASKIVGVCGVSKQAVSQQITHLQRNGYLTVRPHPTDHRARLLETTDKGVRARAFVEQTFAEIEADWVARLGPEDGPELRRLLTTLAGTFGD